MLPLFPAFDVDEAPAIRWIEPSRSARVRIRGGSFDMGSSALEMQEGLLLCRTEVYGMACTRIANTFRSEGRRHKVTLDTFDLDRYEVSVEAYGTCVRAGRCNAPGFEPGDVRFDRPQLPVTYVSWDDATAYCGFVKGRLPTEAEWEYAARGKAGRTFPWGNVYNPRICNHGSFSHDETDARDGYQGLAPIDALADGQTPEHVFNLAGNVAEWVYDLYGIDKEGFGYGAAAVSNPRGPENGTQHVIRGGSYEDGAAWMRSASRHVLSITRASSVGFRCAYDVVNPVR